MRWKNHIFECQYLPDAFYKDYDVVYFSKPRELSIISAKLNLGKNENFEKIYQKIFLKLIFEDVAIKNLNFLCIENKALGMGFHEKKFWKCVLSCLFYIIFLFMITFPDFCNLSHKPERSLTFNVLRGLKTTLLSLRSAQPYKKVCDLMSLYLNRIPIKGVISTHP